MGRRRIVMFNQVSADGFFSSVNGGLDWVVQEPMVHQDAIANMPEIDTMLFGRKTYENFEGFWPLALEDPKGASDPHATGQRSAQMQEMAVWINETAKLVISKTRKRVTWQNSTLMHELDPHAIAALKQQPGKDIIVFGSASIVSQLTQHRSIDDYLFVVSPLLLGKGRSLLESADARLGLKLVEAKSYESGVVLLHYALQ